MKIVIAGGHGQIALLLEQLLSDAGHEVVGIIRNPEHVDDLAARGASGLVIDLERSDSTALAAHLAGVDAVVFAAGAGPGSSAARKLTVDRDGAVMLADAAEQAGIRRYVMVSAMAADSYDPNFDDVFQVYLRAKADADAAIRARDLDWTIVRPGALTDGPGTGSVRVGVTVDRGSIPRADVAALVARLVTTGDGVGSQFEVISGSDAIASVNVDAERQ